MALHAPPHRKALKLTDALHRFDRSVTALAAYTGRHMSSVIEVDIVG